MLDTALALQLRRAGEPILARRARARRARWRERAREHADTLCVGRTHGVHAEPTSFGLKLAGYAFEAHRNAERLERAFAQAAVGRDLGRGRHLRRRSARPTRRACSSGLGLRAEDVSTQVVPRDRHAELLQAIALAGAGLERFATEIRHLQRTEVREVEEPFRAGQKGSSAMPHKRNPITTERITGLARVLRGYAQAALENVALWHERDISHSGAERVILPDATILLDYMQHLALRVVRGMTVHADRMAREPRAHLRRAVLPARAARARRARDARATTPTGSSSALAQQAWDTQTPLRALLGGRARPSRPRPRRDVRLRPLHAPRARGAGAPRRDPGAGMTDCSLYARRPTLGGPLPRHPGSASSTRSSTSRATAAASRSSACSTRRQGARRRRSRCIDPYELGRGRAARRGRSRHSRSSSSCACARAASSGSSARSCRPTSRSRVADHLREGGIELRVDAEAFVARRRVKTEAQIAGHPARPAGRRRGDGASPRG